MVYKLTKVYTNGTWHSYAQEYLPLVRCVTCHYTLTSIMSPSVMSFPLLYPKTLGNRCPQSKSPSCCHISFSYIMGFDIKQIHHQIQTTHSHASCGHYCHYCNVDFVLFHNMSCYTNSLLPCIHVNTTYLLNVTCTLVATCMILWRLECHMLNNIFPLAN